MTAQLPPPGAPLEHYVSTAPFDPQSVERMTPEQERVNQASQRKLMWWKFKRHKLAYASGIFLLCLYLMIMICEMIAPYNLHTRNVEFIHAPPQRVHLFHEGQFVGPFVYGREMTLNMDTLRREYNDIPGAVQKIRFFCRGEPYKFWGVIPGDFRFVCPPKDGEM
ncbi:MAG: ABC transporter permease, partial [Rhizobiaceae bacterium]|nr:ABC transporter permease [Rhizobiaceae bacterium]